MNDLNNFIAIETVREEGHGDTRESNFKCDSRIPRLGCNLGIDIAG